jgi:hypothetical protein
MYKENFRCSTNISESSQQEQEKYFNTLDKMDEGIAIINYKEKYLYVNDSYISQMHFGNCHITLTFL